MSEFTLISFELCPYVQRSVIALEEKGATYRLRHIDLRNKPDWFLQISPFGKVPVLLAGETAVFESSVINEYLDEVVGPTLHPSNPLEKAKHRSWIEFLSTALGAGGWTVQSAADEATTRAAVKAMQGKLSRLEDAIVGPFFAGEDFRLIDAAAGPLLQRLVWCDDAAGLSVFSKFPKITAWWEALAAHPSVQRSTIDDGQTKFLALLEDYGSWVGSFDRRHS